MNKINAHQSSKRALVLIVTAGLTALIISAAQAHEHLHTHYKLTQAAFRYLDRDLFRDPARNAGLTETEIEAEMAQGVVDEDECIVNDTTGGLNASGNLRNWGDYPNWNSHFYEAKRGTPLDIAGGLRRGAGCNKLPDSEFTTAADRARRLWPLAVEDYKDGKRLAGEGDMQQAKREYRSAYRILGRVLHLLEDMTSPAHVHDSPHGENPWTSACGGDSDDFERWGWCAGENNRFINDYFNEASPLEPCVVDIDGDGTDDEFGIPPAGLTCRLWASLQRLYAGQPQGGPNSLDPVSVRAGETLPFAYIRKVANVTYDFTTFAVHLKDDSPFTDVQDPSELKSMLRGSGVNDCGAGVLDKGLCDIVDGWWIGGQHQRIGQTEGNCGSVELAVGDWREEWYVMETNCRKRVVTTVLGGVDIFVDGFAFIENVGGEGSLGTRDDEFIPVRYGCSTGDPALCSDGLPLGPKSKVLYRMLYGTHLNREDPFVPVSRKGKTMLRIYGDVLYPTAVAYGAGLIQAFIDEATEPPVADAGGPYEEEACGVVTLDGSGSSDPNGSIVSYEWDFTDDGSFDVLTDAPTYEHAYDDEFTGQTRLRVTDDEGFTGEDTADVTVTPDVTPPVLEDIRSNPPYLWPPNHKMVPVTVTVETDDACDAEPVCVITEVTSNQPVRGRNDHTSPDWMVTGDMTVDLRAERVNPVPNENNGNGNGNGNGNANGNGSGNGNGVGNNPAAGVQAREYELTVMCTDAAGNSASGKMIVPVNQSAADNKAFDAPPDEPEVEPVGAAENSEALNSERGENGDDAEEAGNALDLITLLSLLLMSMVRRRS